MSVLGVRHVMGGMNVMQRCWRNVQQLMSICSNDVCHGLNSMDTYTTYYLSCRAAQAQMAQGKPEEPLQLQPVHIPDPSDPLTLDLNLPADPTL